MDNSLFIIKIIASSKTVKILLFQALFHQNETVYETFKTS